MAQLVAISHQAAGSYTTTSTSSVDVDAANLALTFTAPASGNVIVRLCGGVVSSAGTAVVFTVREGSTDLGHCQATTFTKAVSVLAEILVTGLSPNSAHTFKWGWFVVGATTATLLTDSTRGPVVMVVEAAP